MGIYIFTFFIGIRNRQEERVEDCQFDVAKEKLRRFHDASKHNTDQDRASAVSFREVSSELNSSCLRFLG